MQQNTVDIFQLKKENYKDVIIGYKRAKTKHSRKDEEQVAIAIHINRVITAFIPQYFKLNNSISILHQRHFN